MAQLTLHWQLRTALVHLRQEGRLAVLLCYLLHANDRLRAWPSTRTLVAETGWSRDMVIAARRWLVTHGALTPVPRAACVAAERQVHPRTTVWQITGQLVVGDTAIPVLFGVAEQIADDRVGRLSEEGLPPPESSGSTVLGRLAPPFNGRLARPEVSNKEVIKPIEVMSLDLEESGDVLVHDVRPEHQRIWAATALALEQQLPRETYGNWLRTAVLQAVDDGTYVVAVGSVFAQQWLAERLKRVVLRALLREAGEAVGVRFVVQWA